MDSRYNVLINLVGLRFGKLLVIKRDEANSKSGNAKWICQCECGNTAVIIGSKLRSGHTQSCGCLRVSDIAQGHSQERLYRTWTGMHQRCYNPKHDRYKWYGQKNIEICPEWHDFITFRDWALASGYDDNLTIDRIQSDGNYEPTNCRWVDMKFQANNRSNNKIVLFRGKNYTVSQLAEYLNLPYYTVRNQMRLGWSIEKIVDQAGGTI